MKKTDLAKNLGLKIRGHMMRSATPGRFAQGAGEPLDRRAQRKLDQAAGLVPFAVKLHEDLVAQLRARAEQEDRSLNEVVAQALRAGLVMPATSKAAGKKAVKPDAAAAVPPAARTPARAPAVKAPVKTAATKKAAATKVAAKKVAVKKAVPRKSAPARGQ